MADFYFNNQTVWFDRLYDAVVSSDGTNVTLTLKYDGYTTIASVVCSVDTASGYDAFLVDSRFVYDGVDYYISGYFGCSLTDPLDNYINISLYVTTGGYDMEGLKGFSVIDKSFFDNRSLPYRLVKGSFSYGSYPVPFFPELKISYDSASSSIYFVSYANSSVLASIPYDGTPISHNIYCWGNVFDFSVDAQTIGFISYPSYWDIDWNSFSSVWFGSSTPSISMAEIQASIDAAVLAVNGYSGQVATSLSMGISSSSEFLSQGISQVQTLLGSMQVDELNNLHEDIVELNTTLSGLSVDLTPVTSSLVSLESQIQAMNVPFSFFDLDGNFGSYPNGMTVQLHPSSDDYQVQKSYFFQNNTNQFLIMYILINSSGKSIVVPHNYIVVPSTVV